MNRPAVTWLLIETLIFVWNGISSADDTILQSPVAEQVCVVQDPRINEASGIASSYLTPDAVWMHNDSGDEPRLFLVGRDGSTLAVLNIPQEKPLDWEDMCSFRTEDQAWLVVADMGDNAENRGPKDQGGKRAPCRLLLIPEPEVDLSLKGAELTGKVFGTIEFTFEDGARDCESIAVDAERREIMLVSKSRFLDCGLYRIPLTLSEGRTIEQAARLSTISVLMATAMDISPDHRRMIVISPLSGVIIDRRAGESWAEASRRPAKTLMLPSRRQGETVCFQNNSGVILLNSEKPHQPLWRLRLNAESR